MKKFAIVYGFVIGMAVLAVVVAFRYGTPAPPKGESISHLAPFASSSPMFITSPSFKNNEFIPVKFSCDASGKRGYVNPEIRIQGVPDGAKSLALIVHDPDAPVAGGFIHWVMWNIPATTTAIGEASVPVSAVEGLNDGGKIGYTDPCPPVGHGVHHYHFKLYALDTVLNIPPDTKKADLENAMANHILDGTELVGLYQR